jgi:hypothetical protein
MVQTLRNIELAILRRKEREARGERPDALTERDLRVIAALREAGERYRLEQEAKLGRPLPDREEQA